MGDINIFCCTNKAACADYREDKTICFEVFPLEAGKIYDYKNRIGLTWIFVLTGQIALEIEEESLSLDREEMLLFTSSNYKFEALQNGELIYFTSRRPTEYCNQLLAELQEKEGNKGLSPLKIAGYLQNFLALLKIYLASGLSCDHLFEQKQQELFMLMKVCYPPEVLENFLYCLFLRKSQDIKRVISDNCLKAKSVEELARLCGYSPGAFKRIFKEIYNVPIYRWMLQQKASYLKVRLLEKDVNLKLLIDELGFSSPAHFTKFCKQWLGMVPTKFIKSQQENLNC